MNLRSLYHWARSLVGYPPRVLLVRACTWIVDQGATGLDLPAWVAALDRRLIPLEELAQAQGDVRRENRRHWQARAEKKAGWKWDGSPQELAEQRVRDLQEAYHAPPDHIGGVSSMAASKAAHRRRPGDAYQGDEFAPIATAFTSTAIEGDEEGPGGAAAALLCAECGHDLHEEGAINFVSTAKGPVHMRCAKGAA